MKPTVYIETTIIGYLTSRITSDTVVAGQMLDTREWWERSRMAFDLYTSELVRAEASRGDAQAAAERLEAMAGLPVLPLSDPARELSKALITRHALPVKARVDSLHAAIAATHGIQYLVTWNCRHLANATLRARIEQVCADQGYAAPMICTPPELSEVQP